MPKIENMVIDFKSNNMNQAHHKLQALKYIVYSRRYLHLSIKKAGCIAYKVNKIF